MMNLKHRVLVRRGRNGHDQAFTYVVRQFDSVDAVISYYGEDHLLNVINRLEEAHQRKVETQIADAAMKDQNPQ